MHKHKTIILGVGLWCLALGCSAVTLGRAQGAAWIGSPLDLKVQLELSDAQEAGAACLEAEVFHADTRQDPRRVRVTLEPGAQGTSAMAHITSSTPVDEPMVTVYLKAGCQQKVSRRYVLLAELRSEVTAMPPPAPPQLPTPAPRPPPARANAVVPTVEIPVAPAATTTAATAPRKAVKPKAEPVPSLAAAPRTTQGNGKSRLKLDMLDLMEDRSPVLKSANELTMWPTDDLQRRAEAAAWWRALNASPEDRLRDATRVQSMEAQVLALQTLTLGNQRSLMELAKQLEKAESERYSNGLVYALVALLLAMLTALFLLWRKKP